MNDFVDVVVALRWPLVVVGFLILGALLAVKTMELRDALTALARLQEQHAALKADHRRAIRTIAVTNAARRRPGIIAGRVVNQ